ncbi:MAG TPA: ZIP family zinc transporter [Thermoleophilia bacterium]|nr:ZIP family zinc transporter [Thermoleophilia bacterium]
MLEALLWGMIAGGALLVGAAAGLCFTFPRWSIALIMAFGVGALISAVTYELTAEAYERGGAAAVLGGLALGAFVFFAGDLAIDRRGGEHRKRSGGQQSEAGGAILLGAVLDGIPESLVIGISLLEGGAVGIAFVLAVFISNLPEGLSGATGLRKAGHRPRDILWLWAVVCVASGLAAALGYGVAGELPGHSVGVVQAFAAGAILTMLADTMMPEAFDEGGHRPWVGLVTVLGFATAALLQFVA